MTITIKEYTHFIFVTITLEIFDTKLNFWNKEN